MITSLQRNHLSKMVFALLCCLMLTCPTSAGTSQTGAIEATAATPVETLRGYVQFSGAGRTILTVDNDRPSSYITDEAKPSITKNQWTLAIAEDNGERTAQLQAADGRWLKYENELFSLVDNQADATAFGWALNTYYAEYTNRHQLLLPGNKQRAVGVRLGKLQAVAANSRYAVMRVVSEVKGAELPLTMSNRKSHYYYLTFNYAHQSFPNYIKTKDSTPQFYASGTKVDTNNGLWRIEEANELGDIRLATRDNVYACQPRDGQIFSTTTDVAQAAVMRLVENCDKADQVVQCTYNDTESGTVVWSNFWQMKNTANGEYLYIGDNYQNSSTSGGCMGGKDDSANKFKDTKNEVQENGAYGLANNRCQFVDAHVQDGQLHYVQFSGNGRTILSENDGRPVAITLDKGDETPEEAVSQWAANITSTGTSQTITLCNDNGMWLRYANKRLSLTANEAEATAFPWVVNTYYKEYSNRYQMLLPDNAQKAIGVRGEKLGIVTANSRYSVTMVVEKVKGANNPLIESSRLTRYYYLGYHYAHETNPNYVKVQTSYPYFAAFGTKSADNNGYFAITEANELGDVYLRSRGGDYAYQSADGLVYGTTKLKANATVFRLVESVDKEDQLVYSTYNTASSTVQWAYFWQLKNAKNDEYLFIGDQNRMGGATDAAQQFKDNMNTVRTKGAYGLANNRMDFLETGVEDAVDASYLQFTGMGRNALVASEDGLTAAVVKVSEQQPAGDRYKWWIDRDGNSATIECANGKWLKYTADDMTFSLVDDEGEATIFGISNSTYYETEHLERYNLLPAPDAEQAFGVDNSGRFTLVAPNSRYASLRSGANINGAEPIFLSTSDREEFYNMGLIYKQLDGSADSKNYFYTTSPSTLSSSENSYTRLNSRYIWMLYDTGDGTGDFILKSLSGFYIMQQTAATPLSITTDESQAARFRLYDGDDGTDEYAPYWQMKNVANDMFVFIGWQNKVGGSSNQMSDSHYGIKKGAYNHPNNRLVFNKTLSNIRGYLTYSAMGPFPLIDMDGYPSVLDGMEDLLNIKGAMWNIEAIAGGHYVLRNDENHYMAYDEEENTFTTTPDKAAAYPYTLQFSTYQNNESVRYELCSTDGKQAMCAAMVSVNFTGELFWGPRNTRYAVTRITDFVSGPILPSENQRGEDLHVYAIYTSSRNFTHYMLQDTGEESYMSTVDMPNEDYDRNSEPHLQDYIKNLWVATRTETDGAYIGDCNMRSYRGHWLKYDESSGRFIMSATEDGAAIIRLVESDDNSTSWQVQYVGKNVDGKFVPYTGAKNIMQLKFGSATSGIRDNTFTLGAPNDPYNYLIVDEADVYPEFFEEKGGFKRALQFVHVEGSPFISQDPDGETVSAKSSSETDAESTWKTIGDNNDFVVKNHDGTYMGYDADTKKFVIVKSEAEAARFKLMQNIVRKNDEIVWCFCILDENHLLPDNSDDVQCIVRNNDGTLRLDKYLDYYTKVESGIYFTARTSPHFSSGDVERYSYISFPAMNSSQTTYLTGSEDGNLKVIGKPKTLNTVQRYSTKVEFINNQLWAFIGTTDDFTMMTRDSTYLAWNSEDPIGAYDPDLRDDCFTVVLDSTQASHFELHYDEAGNGNFIIQFKPSDKADISVRNLKGYYLNLMKGNSELGTSGGNTSANPYNGPFYLGLQAEKVYAFNIERWTVSDAEDYTYHDILHKKSWFVYQAQQHDEEDMAGFITKTNTTGYVAHPTTGENIQQANTFTSHFYIKDGTYRYLYLPSMMRVAGSTSEDVGASAVRAYQRFYNYDTDGPIDSHRVILKRKSRRDYSNGTIMGMYLPLNAGFGAFVGEEVTFQMPPYTPNDYRYTVGIDASCYTDFVDYFGEKGLVYEDSLRTSTDFIVPQNQDLIEPTISGRYLYVIHNAREMADSMYVCTGNSDKWIETHSITFPKKKVGLRNSTLPFNLQLQNYWFYAGNQRPSKYQEEQMELNKTLRNVTSYNDLEFEIEDNAAGIALWYPSGVSATVSDYYPIDNANNQYSDLSECRFLRFLYPKAKADGTPDPGTKQMALPDEVGFALGDSAVIKVYAVDKDNGIRFNLARFYVHFADDTEPRPYTDVLGYSSTRSAARTIGDNADGEGDARATTRVRNDFLSPRSPQALEAEYGSARATIDFNAHTFVPFQTPPFGRSTVAKHTNNTLTGSNAPLLPQTTIDNSYGIPLLFDHTSYDFQPYDFANTRENPWGSYTLSKRVRTTWLNSSKNTYRPVRSLYKDAYPDRNYDDTNAAFLYVDASELPGTICSLEYNGVLCKGSRLYFSAWLSSPDSPYGDTSSKTGSSTPGTVILTVKGVQTDEHGNKIKETVLYNYCPGPIFEDARAADGTIVHHGSGEEGVWQQVYFSFINNGSEQYNRYELTVDNACTDSKGGDIMIDEVQMFAMKPSVAMERTTPVCGQRVTLAKLTCDYMSMLETLGYRENEDPAVGMPDMWYCLLDKEIYDNALAGIARPTQYEVAEAFNAALIGQDNAAEESERAFRHVQFSTHYDQIPEFSFREALDENLNTAIIRRQTDGKGEKHLIISDKVNSTKIKGRHKYYLMFVPRYGDDPITMANAVQEFQVGDSCCIMSEFETAASVNFVDDAADSTATNGLITVCANKSVNISAKLNGIKPDGTFTNLQPIYDWWLDYVQCDFTHAFINAQGEFVEHADGITHERGEVSLREALINFRHHYPQVTSFDGIKPVVADESYPFTQAMLDGLTSLTLNVPDQLDEQGNVIKEGHIAPLHLYSVSLNVTLPEPADDTDVAHHKVITVLPIQTQASDSIIYCYDPQQLNITISGIAPSLSIGYRQHESQYPAYLTDGSLRMGEDFFAQVTGKDAASQPNRLLRLPMRNVKVVSKNTAIGLKLINQNGVDYAPIYLVGTNDAQTEVFDNTTGAADFRKVGRVVTLKARRDGDADSEAYADAYFFSDFKPREGCYYALRMGYVEEFEEGHQPTPDETSVCDGSMTFYLHIVPKYEVWTGAAGTTDWTDDANWVRADATDLQGMAGYTDNATNGSATGYVPMTFTNVIIAANAPTQPQLYSVGNNEGASDLLHFNTADAPSPRTAGKDIEYALIADGKTTQGAGTKSFFTCRPFHTYLCNDLVLQAGAELVHSERLTDYGRAWVEYALRPDRWYTLGSPLQRMFAGDWYTPSASGRQLTPYFTDIKFSPTAYNRYSPAVYQRGWDKGKAIVYYLQGNAADASATQSVDVAVKADWSPVYNDVTVPYAQGGFSLKADAHGTDGRTYADELLFRLPKEDAAFSYYNIDGTLSGNEQSIDRYQMSGTKSVNATTRLQSDALTSEGSTLTQTLTNRTAANRYFLASNPFTCGLDMRKFFAANASVLGQSGWRYWMLTAQGQSAVMRGDNAEGWININADTPDADGGIVAAGQGFFVLADAAAITSGATGGTITLKFTADMMTSGKRAPSGTTLQSMARTQSTSSSSTCPMLRIKALRGGEQSEAIIIKDASAANGYNAAEDMQTLIDGSLPTVPTIYTVADSAAVTVNRRRSLYRVPLGISSQSTDPVHLVFTGMRQFSETLSLLDDFTGNVTPLTLAPGAASTDTATVEVNGLSVGRYYLLTSEQPAPEDALTDDRPFVTLEGQHVTIHGNATHPLTYVQVVDAAGRELYRFTPYTPTLSLSFPLGTYVISSRTATRQAVTKVSVGN